MVFYECRPVDAGCFDFFFQLCFSGRCKACDDVIGDFSAVFKAVHNVPDKIHRCICAVGFVSVDVGEHDRNLVICAGFYFFNHCFRV